MRLRTPDEIAANKRRIVACVNACAGLSTRTLELLASYRLALGWDLTVRDQLLVACKMVLDDPSLTASANDVIRSAIALAEAAPVRPLSPDEADVLVAANREDAP